MRKKRIRLLISGRVQRVFFRDSAKRKALALGICGWVKNREDGGVEILIEGEDRIIDDMINWSKKGPVLARVDGIEIIEEGYSGEFKDFKIIN